ncbi:D-aminoacylase [Candidatus Bathyarchaeota archaeon]|nr:D-aminoacylase [Candidatus Bathyarchaeota archaeon]
MLDILIKNGVIIDGTGNPWYKAEVGIKEGKIIQVGRIDKPAEKVLDASGLVVAPGFIDTHSHSDLMLLAEPLAKQKIMQGVTTEVIGQDGLGEAPLSDEMVSDWRKYLSGLNGNPDLDWDWKTFSEYLSKIEEAKPSTNVASLVGHGNLRMIVIGMENRKPSPTQLGEMKSLLDEAMRQGAFGLSTGLIYPPCTYSETSELVELCKVASLHKGIFVIHMRDEGDKLLESIEEVIRVGREANIPVHISHFKASGERNWGKAGLALQALYVARRQNIDVTADQYPYTAGSTFLSSLLPTWVHEGGTEAMLKRLIEEDARKRVVTELSSSRRGSDWGWSSVYVTAVKTQMNKRFEGKSLGEIASIKKMTPMEALIDLVIEEENEATMVSFSMSEDDVRTIMKSHLTMVCTDGILLGKPHPRAYGSFPRVLGKYVREGVIRLEEAVKKMTSTPATRFGLLDRGLIRPGMCADVTIFNPEKIADMATYQDPVQFPQGIEYVIVNGKVTVQNGMHLGTRAGRILRHPISKG